MLQEGRRAGGVRLDDTQQELGQGIVDQGVELPAIPRARGLYKIEWIGNRYCGIDLALLSLLAQVLHQDVAAQTESNGHDVGPWISAAYSVGY